MLSQEFYLNNNLFNAMILTLVFAERIIWGRRKPGGTRKRPTLDTSTTAHCRWLLQGTCFRYYTGGYTPLRLRVR